MVKYKLNKRRKAPFGTQDAATIAAAGISATAIIANAATQAKASKEQTKQQAQSALQQAQMQTNALQKVNTNNNQLKEAEQQFISEQNQEANQIAKDTQMTLQMLAGQQNENARLEGAKIQVKCGGSVRNRALQGASLLQGGNRPTMGFTVTDGGGVVPLGQTGNGKLYEIKGNDHDHYHKTKNGIYKTGVGIKFDNGTVIEGDGDQNSNLGELLYVTPDYAEFISKHTIKGFNPAKAVRNGMHPELSFALQEEIKDAYNIADNGESKAMLGKLTTYNNINNINSMINDAAGIVYLDNKRKLKYGGRCKANNGLNLIRNPNNYWYYKNNSIDDYGISRSATYYNDPGISSTSINLDNPSLKAASITHVEANGKSSDAYSNFANRAQLTGAGINLGTNFLSAGIINNANRKDAKLRTDANNQAAALRAYGISQMTGIDPSIINRNNYRTGHMMATIRTPYVNINPELALIERSRQRVQDVAKNNSISGAAMNNRFRRAEMDAYDQRSQVYSRANQTAEQIKQENAKSITETSKVNAMLDTQAMKDYTTAMIDVAKYNNDIRNIKATGVPDAYADALANNGQIRANLAQSIGSNIAEANLKGASGYSNVVSLMGQQAYSKQLASLGIDNNIVTDSIIRDDDKTLGYQYYNKYKNSSNKALKAYADKLNKHFRFETKYGGSIKRNRLKNANLIS